MLRIVVRHFGRPRLRSIMLRYKVGNRLSLREERKEEREGKCKKTEIQDPTHLCAYVSHTTTLTSNT